MPSISRRMVSCTRRAARVRGAAGRPRPAPRRPAARGQLVEDEEAGAQAVIEIVVAVGDVVGDRRELRLQPAAGGQSHPPGQRMLGHGRRRRRGSGPLCLTRPSSVSEVRFRPSKSA